MLWTQKSFRQRHQCGVPNERGAEASVHEERRMGLSFPRRPVRVSPMSSAFLYLVCVAHAPRRRPRRRPQAMTTSSNDLTFTGILLYLDYTARERVAACFLYAHINFCVVPVFSSGSTLKRNHTNTSLMWCSSSSILAFVRSARSLPCMP